MYTLALTILEAIVDLSKLGRLHNGRLKELRNKIEEARRLDEAQEQRLQAIEIELAELRASQKKTTSSKARSKTS